MFALPWSATISSWKPHRHDHERVDGNEISTRMNSVRHLIVEGSSSSVVGGGAGTTSYHTLYLPHAIQETDQKCFATDGALLSDMLARQSSLGRVQGGPKHPFCTGGTE